MKDNFKLLIVGVLLIIVSLVVSLRIKNSVDTISKGAEQYNRQEEIPQNSVDIEVGPTLTLEQAEEAIEENNRTGGFYDTGSGED